MKKDEKDTLKKLIKEQIKDGNVYPIERARELRKANALAPEVAKFAAAVKQLEALPENLGAELNALIKASQGLNEAEKSDYVNALKNASKRHELAIQEIKMHARSIFALIQNRAKTR